MLTQERMVSLKGRACTNHGPQRLWCSFHRSHVFCVCGTRRGVPTDYRHPLEGGGEVEPLEDLVAVHPAFTGNNSISWWKITGASYTCHGLPFISTQL